MKTKNEKIEDKLNIHYLRNLFDFIKFGPKCLDIDRTVDDIVEYFGNEEELKKLKILLLDLHRRTTKLEVMKIKRRHSKERILWLKIKLNQKKGRRKGYWYRGLLLMQKWIKEGREKEAIEFARNQMKGLKEKHPSTYYYHKKDLKEIGIEI